MNRSSSLLTFSVSFLAACAGAHLAEVKPLSTPLAKYETVSLEVASGPELEQHADVHRAQLAAAIEKAITGDKTFAVVPRAGHLVLRITIDGATGPGDTQEALCRSGSALCASDEATVQGTMTIVDGKTGTSLARVTGTGSSKRDHRGFQLDAVHKSPDAMANDDFAWMVSTYLTEHRK